MVNSIQCPGCAQRYNLKASLAGKHVKCKKCGQSFQIPIREEVVEPTETDIYDLKEDPPASPGGQPSGGIAPLDNRGVRSPAGYGTTGHPATQFPNAQRAGGHPRFGNLIYEKKPEYLALGLGVLVGIGLTFASPVFVGGPMGVLAMLLGIGVVIACIGGMTMFYSFYERGLRSFNLSGSKAISYEEVHTLVFALTDNYYNGAYTGTTFKIGLSCDGASGKTRSISINGAFKKNKFSALLEDLRDHIARIIAERMANRLSAGEPVSWGPGIAFATDGFQYQRHGILGKKALVCIPYSQVANYGIDEGVFTAFYSAFVDGYGNPVKAGKFTVHAAHDNFWPGFNLFLSMFGEE